MPLQVIFQEQERGLTLLQRGWRTPDPSPTRDAAGLPAAAVKLCLAAEYSTPQPPATTRRGHSRTPSPTPRLNWPSSKEDDGLYDLSGTWEEQDGACTPRGHMPPARPGKGARSPNRTVRVRTPSPDGGYPWAGCLATTPLQGVPMPPAAPQGQAPPMLLASRLSRHVDASEREVPRGGSLDASSSDGDAAAMPSLTMAYSFMPTAQLPAPAPAEGPAVPGVPWQVSKGSIGHPTHCAGACKYVWKKKGCKDGALCDRCHLCEWKRYQGSRATRRTEEQALARR
mmetsp:Transcript_61714/g.198874  ORF Transcript_61714/g.198874 Transcript_61714/m.198874 type:complete len:284 (-) Transcript_61714:71-922(-)